MSKLPTVLKNGLVFVFSDHFEQLDIAVEHGIISSFSDSYSESAETIDCSDCLIVPGLTDIHFHGCSGHDYCDADTMSLDDICKYELSHGVTTICPTTMTLPENDIINTIETTIKYLKKPAQADRSEIVGINLEGPFISPAKCGAQKKEYAQLPCPEMLLKLNELSQGLIKLVTIAPELEGASECIKACRDTMHISLGHTECSYDEAMSAFSAGADHVTHLYNAMPSFHHRDTGLIGAAADTQKCFVELIADGVHVSPSAVRAAFKLFGDDRIVLISDSMEAAGMPDGEYSLGGNKVFKKGSEALLKDGTLAGSVSTLYDCFLSAVNMGLSLDTVIRAATINPCRSIGIDNCYGSIDIGKKADLLILNKDLTVRKIIKS